jgi:pimeloyl-ACP methyl ester carboxylesterase
MSGSLPVIFCLPLILLFSASVKAQETQPGKLTIEPYTLRTFDGQEQAAELGQLSVPENRMRPAGRTIKLAFVRLRSTAKEPGSPIVFLAGGPGVPGIVMGQVPIYFRLFDRLREVSDVILLDQRGTGQSTPNLECSLDARLPADTFETTEKAVRGLTASVRVCAEKWRAEGVELAAYTTNASADDLEDLRRALGAERLSLIGFSYGTELALATIRRHGRSIERVVFASMRGPDNVMKLPGALDMQLRRLARLADKDAAIHQLTPDLFALTGKVLDELERRPVTVSITERRSKQKLELKVGKVALQALLQNSINDGRAVIAVPALIHSTSRGDYAILARQVEKLYNGLNAGVSSMTVAMDCASGWSAERAGRAGREGRASLLGNVMNLQLRPEICALVGSPDLGPEFRSRVWSNTPALFISGALDGGSPPYQAEEVRWGFPNSTHLIVEHGWHETLPDAEVQAAVLDFFKGTDVSRRAITLASPRFLSVEEAKAR